MLMVCKHGPKQLYVWIVPSENVPSTQVNSGAEILSLRGLIKLSVTFTGTISLW